MTRAVTIAAVITGTLTLSAQLTPYPPFPAGMRLLVGSTGALVRNQPGNTSQCGTPPHDCTAADAVPPGTYGVVQSDPPVLDPAGWHWLRMAYESGQTGWSSAYPPYLNALSPPQMMVGTSFRVVGDYEGPQLTEGTCVSDGLNSPAILSLAANPNGTGQKGTLQCEWKAPPVGNHIAVIIARNAVASAASAEFQFVVAKAAVPQPPVAPQNLRIGPTVGTTRLGEAASASKPAGVTAK